MRESQIEMQPNPDGMSPEETQELINWAELHPEQVQAKVGMWMAICGHGGYEDWFNYRGVIREAREDFEKKLAKG